VTSAAGGFAGWRLLSEIGPDVTVVGRLSQELRVDQNIQHSIAGFTVETPQPLELLPGQVKTGNLGELAADDLEPIRHCRLSW
jgi:hypothetical protein